jgi:hypothetical protein
MITLTNLQHEDHVVESIKVESVYPHPVVKAGREIRVKDIECPVCKKLINYVWIDEEDDQKES